MIINFFNKLIACILTAYLHELHTAEKELLLGLSLLKLVQMKMLRNFHGVKLNKILLTVFHYGNN